MRREQNIQPPKITAAHSPSGKKLAPANNTPMSARKAVSINAQAFSGSLSNSLIRSMRMVDLRIGIIINMTNQAEMYFARAQQIPIRKQ